MKIDIHVHVADIEALLSAGQAGLIPRSNRHLHRVVRWAAAEQALLEGVGGVTERWMQRLAGWIRESDLDQVVLLALDGVFDESGRPSPGKTVLHVDNDFVATVAGQQPEFLFGASIHPYRKDAVNELERLIEKGACLVKWIPSAQQIEPDNPRCMPFYEALAHFGVPLLSHTGVEHTLGSRRASRNHPQRLIPALEQGVSVIAAHCGVHLFLHEPSYFGAWASLARQYENLHGDSGAFSIVTRVPALKRTLKDHTLRGKLLYGSDFPGIPAPKWCWQLGLRTMRKLSQISNPLARNMRVMQALEMPAGVFERAHKQLGIGKKKETA